MPVSRGTGRMRREGEPAKERRRESLPRVLPRRRRAHSPPLLYATRPAYAPALAGHTARRSRTARARFTRPTSSQRRPASRRGVSDPLSSNVAHKIERSRRVGQNRRPGARARSIEPLRRRGVIWPRGAAYGFRARPWRPWPHPPPGGPSAVRRFESIGRFSRLRFPRLAQP